jgi:hypothetical protein
MFPVDKLGKNILLSKKRDFNEVRKKSLNFVDNPAQDQDFMRFNLIKELMEDSFQEVRECRGYRFRMRRRRVYADNARKIFGNIDKGRNAFVK